MLIMLKGVFHPKVKKVIYDLGLAFVADRLVGEPAGQELEGCEEFIELQSLWGID